MARWGDDGIVPHRFGERTTIPLELEFAAHRGGPGEADVGAPSVPDADTAGVRFELPLQCLGRLEMDTEVSDFLCDRLLSPVLEAARDEYAAIVGVAAPFNLSHHVRQCLSRHLAARFSEVRWIPCELLAVLLYLGEHRPADFDAILADGGHLRLAYSDGHDFYSVDGTVYEEHPRSSHVPVVTISVKNTTLRRSAHARAAHDLCNELLEAPQDSDLRDERRGHHIVILPEEVNAAVMGLSPEQVAAGAAVYAGMFCGRGTTRRCYVYPLGRYVGIRVGKDFFYPLVEPGTRWPVRREIELVLQVRGGAAQVTVLEGFAPEAAGAAEIGHLRVSGIPERDSHECRGVFCLAVDRSGSAWASMEVDGVESGAEITFGLGPHPPDGGRPSERRV